jgi:hypothetical protein
MGQSVVFGDFSYIYGVIERPGNLNRLIRSQMRYPLRNEGVSGL